MMWNSRPQLVNIFLLVSIVWMNTDLISPSQSRILERPEGLKDVTIDCPFSTLHAIPVWLIGQTAYYFTTLPQNFIGLPNGDLQIRVVDRSLNGTTFQCIVPFEDGERYSDIIELLVTGDGTFPVFVASLPREESQLAIVHQNSHFKDDSKLVSWNTFNTESDTCRSSDMSARGCNTNNDLRTYLSRASVNNFTVNTTDLVDDVGQLQYFNITAQSTATNEICNLTIKLHRFQIETNATTIPLYIPILSEKCGICIDLPPRLDRRGTPYIALPVFPTEPDVFCPLSRLKNNCAILDGCDNFNSTQYTYSTFLTICTNSTASNDLQMCFHNFPQEFNGTKLFHFYSNLQCVEGGEQLATRRYTTSFELVAKSEEGNFSVNISDSGRYICMQADTSECHSANDTLFNVTLSLGGCELYRQYNIANTGCIDLVELQLTNCLPLTINVEASHPGVNFNRKSLEIADTNSEDSVCPCIVGKVYIGLKVQGSTETSINFHLNCSSTLCDNVELHLTFSDTGDDEMPLRMQVYNCSEHNVVFDHLKCGSNYTVHVASPVTKSFNQDCFLEEHTASTQPCGGSPIIIIVVSIVCAVIIIALFVLMIFLIKRLVKELKKGGCCRSRSRQPIRDQIQPGDFRLTDDVLKKEEVSNDKDDIQSPQSDE